nr:hypothetical protein [Tanacetum cinerariifolium]
GKKVIVNEASIRRDLRLVDAEGTACLPNPTIFEELARMRVGTGFSGAITPLFETMMVQAPKEVGEIPTDTQDTPILTQPSSSQPQRKHKSRRKQRKETKVSQDETPTEEHIPTPSHDPLPSGKDRLQLNELMEICTKFSDMVFSLEQINTNQEAEIEKLNKRVKKLEGKKKKRTRRLKRIYKVGLSARIISSDEEGLGDQEDASKQGKIDEIHVDEDLSLINETAQDQEVSAGEKEEQSENFFKRNIMPKEKGISMQKPFETPFPKLIVSSQQPSQPKDKGKAKMVEPERPLKRKKQIMMDEQIARDLEAQMQDIVVESSKRPIEEVESNKSKKQKLDKNVQAEVTDDTAELKRCMGIVPEDDDEVTIKATPISSKSLTIVDYKIYKEGKKS